LTEAKAWISPTSDSELTHLPPKFTGIPTATMPGVRCSREYEYPWVRTFSTNSAMSQRVGVDEV